MKTAMQEAIEHIEEKLKILSIVQQTESTMGAIAGYQYSKYLLMDLLEREKEQIIEAYEDGKQNGMDSITNIYMYIIGEKYYYEKYKQDRELPKDVKDMLDNL
jgi:uncharacterized protein YbgA (DUF1722 family)